MASYLFLIHPDGVDLGAMAPADKKALWDRFVTWSESIKARGHLRGVESLMDDGGSTIRKRDGAVLVDGPYAEMRELVSGLFVVEVESLAAAQALGGECPLLDLGGSVEVREIAPFPIRP